MNINLPTVTGVAVTGFGLLLTSDRVDRRLAVVGTLVAGIALIILGQSEGSKNTAAPLVDKNVEKKEVESDDDKLGIFDGFTSSVISGLGLTFGLIVGFAVVLKILKMGNVIDFHRISIQLEKLQDGISIRIEKQQAS